MTPQSGRSVKTGPMDPPPFQLRVKELRNALGLSGNELAVRVGVAKRTIERIEAGAIPTPVTLYKLAVALGTFVDALYDRDWAWAARRDVQKRTARQLSTRTGAQTGDK